MTNAKRQQRLELGRCGENLATEITFDISAWQEEFGSGGTVVLLHQRNGDDAPYPVAVTVEDGTVIWAVTSADVASPGSGMAELQYLIDSVVVKSAIWTTYTRRSLDDPGDAPDPQSGWVADLIARIEELVDGIDGGGSSVTVDSELSGTSENPVQNQAIYTALARHNGYIYTTAGAAHTFAAASNGGLIVTIGAKLISRLPGDTATLDWAAISTDIQSSISIDGNTATITLSRYSHMLVYNATDHLLHIRNMTASGGYHPDDVVLVANGYATPMYGCIVDEYYIRQFDAAKAKLAGIEAGAQVNPDLSGYATTAQLSAKVDISQGVANAGKFLVVGSDGNVTAVTMAAWSGGSY